MIKPRAKYRKRPKKRGARKRQKVKAQRKRLLAMGFKEEYVDKLITDAEVREALKKIKNEKRSRRKS